MDARASTQPILESLRLRVYVCDLTQREIEKRIGFSRGYLSQVLGGTVEIKLWQLLAILDVVGVEPVDFFDGLYPRRGSQALEVFERLRNSPQAQQSPLNLELARLYGFGIESVEEFRDRLAQCEDALEELKEVEKLAAGEDPATKPDI
jgi:transcriptional regulator with XRE-family HTH domain